MFVDGEMTDNKDLKLLRENKILDLKDYIHQSFQRIYEMEKQLQLLIIFF